MACVECHSGTSATLYSLTNRNKTQRWLTAPCQWARHTGSMQSKAQRKPISAPALHRIATLDALRGLALVGILLVNMEYYSQTVYDGWVQPEFRGWGDMTVRWFVTAFFQWKAYLVFALLFGYGVGMQLQTRESTPVLKANHIRRMLMLAILGIAHAALLFSGDILITYALCGMIGIAFWQSSPLRLIAWSALAFVTGFSGGMLLVIMFLMLPEAMAVNIDIGAVRDTYANGTLPEIVTQRLVDVVDALPLIFIIQGPMSLAMMLTGIAMARLAVLTAPHRHQSLLRGMLRWGLPIGLLGSVVAAALTLASSPDSLAAGVAFMLQLLVAPALSFAFIAWIAMRSSKLLPRWVLIFASSGRMSLTVYLGQSLLSALIFTAYGLGLFGQFGPAVCLLIAVAVSLFFVWFSHQWFKRYRFGPLEWLLRSVTYWRWQPFRKELKSCNSRFNNMRVP